MYYYYWFKINQQIINFFTISLILKSKQTRKFIKFINHYYEHAPILVTKYILKLLCLVSYFYNLSYASRCSKPNIRPIYYKGLLNGKSFALAKVIGKVVLPHENMPGGRKYEPEAYIKTVNFQS